MDLTVPMEDSIYHECVRLDLVIVRESVGKIIRSNSCLKEEKSAS